MISDTELNAILNARWLQIAAAAWDGYTRIGHTEIARRMGRGFLFFTKEDHSHIGQFVPSLFGVFPGFERAHYLTERDVKLYDQIFGDDTPMLPRIEQYDPNTEVIVVLQETTGSLTVRTTVVQLSRASATPSQAASLLGQIDSCLDSMLYGKENGETLEKCVEKIRALGEAGRAHVHMRYIWAQRNADTVQKALEEVAKSSPAFGLNS